MQQLMHPSVKLDPTIFFAALLLLPRPNPCSKRASTNAALASSIDDAKTIQGPEKSDRKNLESPPTRTS